MDNKVTASLAARPTEIVGSFLLSVYAAVKAWGPALTDAQDASILGLIATTIPLVTLIATAIKKRQEA